MQGQDDGGHDVNYYKAALKNQWNIAGMVGLLALGILVSPAFFLFAAAGEIAYLYMAPRNATLRRALRREAMDRDVAMQLEAEQEEVKLLPSPEQASYHALARTCSEIKKRSLGVDSSTQMIISESVAKLDGFRQTYLAMLGARHRYREFLRQAKERRLDQEIGKLRREMKSRSKKARKVMEKNIALKQAMLDKINTAHENLDLLNAQLDALRTTLEYVELQSHSVKDPQSILSKIGEVVADIKRNEEAVREADLFFSAVVEVQEEIPA